MSTAPQRRNQIIELLQLIASEDRQLAYERNVPHVDVTAELICMWFDDQGDPQQGYFDSPFTSAELNALEEFHRFYAERVDQLPESLGTVRTWLSSPVWQEVMKHARRTLEQITA